MSMIIDRLVIEVQTADGPYGLDLTFSKGLCVLRVENSHGKSTCVNAIAYALGMEMALGQQTAKPPFPPSLLKTIQDEQGAEKLVISSHVKLQVTNNAGHTVTLKRNVLGADSESIIEVFQGGIDSVDGEPQRLFLHREGDTTRELGFYSWFSNFMDWKLPLVPNNVGGEYPLYPPAFFPLYFVEQKKGWSSIQATTPFHFNIPQVKKRAFEFIMNLDVNDIVKRKAANKSNIDEVQKKWSLDFFDISNCAIRIGGKVVGIQETPKAKFDAYKLDLLIESGRRWRSLSSVLDEKRNKLFELKRESSKTENIAAESGSQIKELRKLKEDLRFSEVKYDEFKEEIGFLLDQIRSTNIRIDGLIDDKRKYEDLKKIKSFRSLNGLPIIDNECPTCGQSYADHTSALTCDDELMTLDESLDFVKSQLKTFRSVLGSYKNQLGIKRIEERSLAESIDRTVKDIERIEEDLYSGAPSVDETLLREKINIENQIGEFEAALVTLAEYRSKFDSHHSKYRELIRVRRSFPEHGFSVRDKEKLTALEKKIVMYLEQFGFSSFSADLLRISFDNYLPTREGFDLGFDTSASDGIRVIWSYLLAIFSLKDEFSTNHPGVLIFDEPRQQEANHISFINLLKGASTASETGQIIFATSEEEEVLKKGLIGFDYDLISFSAASGKILRKL